MNLIVRAFAVSRCPLIKVKDMNHTKTVVQSVITANSHSRWNPKYTLINKTAGHLK